VERWIQCTACGAKVRADRPACPRCRTKFVQAPERDPVAEAKRSRTLAMWSAAALGLAVVVVAAVWITKDPEPSTTSVARPVDPFAARRPQPQNAPAPAEAEPGPERPFLDASGAGAVAYADGNFASALEQFQAAVARNPDDAESLSNLGQLLVKLGRTAEAIPYFERAIKIIPQRWAYRFNLARAQGLLGKWDEAVATYREAQQLFPNDYATTFNLAMALHKKGDDAGAVDEYKKAIALDPNDASFRMALAISLEKLQRRTEAAAAYNDYLQLAPSAPDAERVRARIAQLSGQATPTPAPPAGSNQPGSDAAR
jgi:Flp pilus assembly protein TadD